MTPTGWDNGLPQDYNRQLGAWFANRLGARQQLRNDMKDKELLELAAKAAGMQDIEHGTFGLYRVIGIHEDGKKCMVEWNPLTDDGDALRLAATLRLKIHPGGA